MNTPAISPHVGGVHDIGPIRLPTREQLARGIAIYRSALTNGLAMLARIAQLIAVADTRRRYPMLTSGLTNDEVLVIDRWMRHPPGP